MDETPEGHHDFVQTKTGEKYSLGTSYPTIETISRDDKKGVVDVFYKDGSCLTLFDPASIRWVPNKKQEK